MSLAERHSGITLNNLTPTPAASNSMQVSSGGRERLVAALHSVAAGDRSALAEIYSATSAKLFGVCLRILSDRSEAEDALQDAYLTVWRNAGRFDAALASPITWLVTLTRNRALDRLRGRRPFRLEPLELGSEVPDPADGADLRVAQDQESARLGACLGTLERSDTVLIRAAFFEGSSYSELAARAALPLGTVKSRIRRALLKLRECLSQ
jgi:RNA polymerase sigma factor (sigma-70 family)